MAALHVDFGNTMPRRCVGCLDPLPFVTLVPFHSPAHLGCEAVLTDAKRKRPELELPSRPPEPLISLVLTQGPESALEPACLRLGDRCSGDRRPHAQ